MRPGRLAKGISVWLNCLCAGLVAAEFGVGAPFSALCALQHNNTTLRNRSSSKNFVDRLLCGSCVIEFLNRKPEEVGEEEVGFELQRQNWGISISWSDNRKRDLLSHTHWQALCFVSVCTGIPGKVVVITHQRPSFEQKEQTGSGFRVWCLGIFARR